MSNKLATSIGFLIGVGFTIPSLFGVISPINSAAHWKLDLVERVSIDQYRTLSLLVLAVGVLIIIGVVRSSSIRASLLACVVLVGALLLGRVLSFSVGETTLLLVLETTIEILAFIAAVWAYRSVSYIEE